MTGVHSVVPDHVKTRRGHCGAQTHQQVFGREDQCAGPIFPSSTPSAAAS